MLKNIEKIENTEIREQEEFSKNNKMVFSVFSKIVIKNSFQRYKPNSYGRSCSGTYLPFTLGSVWFLFMKIVFVLKNEENMENTFGSEFFFFCSKKHKEYRKH